MKSKIKLLLKRSKLAYESASKTYNYLFELYSYYLRLESRWVTWYKYGRGSEAPVDPLRIIWVDPSEINLMIDKSFFNEPDHVTEIKGGDWENATEPVTEYDLYQAMKTVFENGHDWEETDFYERVVDIIQGGQQKWGCSSVSEFDKRCARLNILYETIKKQGYKSQNEIGSGNPNDPIKNQRNYRYAPELSEVIVVIDQSGEFYFYDGRHRFIISKLLNIDRIPVRVKARHANWQILREQYLYDDLRHEEHPDLQYISNHK